MISHGSAFFIELVNRLFETIEGSVIVKDNPVTGGPAIRVRAMTGEEPGEWFAVDRWKTTGPAWTALQAALARRGPLLIVTDSAYVANGIAKLGRWAGARDAAHGELRGAHRREFEAEVAQRATDAGVPMRIGVNSGAEWFVVEQPPGNKGWEAEVTRSLAEAGYHSARTEFAACDLGAPHIRRRVFILANPCLARLSIAWEAIPQEIERIARATTAGNPWHEGPPRGLRVANGPSGWLDRNAAVEAIGDANPPAMATVIGRAIMKAVNQRTEP